MGLTSRVLSSVMAPSSRISQHGVVTVSAGGTTGRHLHIGGQIIYAISGRGWVEANGERVELEPGDLLSCPPGELHDHGAVTDSHFSHLPVTTGGYEFPDRP